MLHTGSRGYGHQIATDFIKKCENETIADQIEIPDKQLSCARINSQTGQEYLGAMACAANFAFVNRSLITSQIRKAFAEIFSDEFPSMQIKLVYDVCHNIAKFEEHLVENSVFFLSAVLRFFRTFIMIFKLYSSFV